MTPFYYTASTNFGDHMNSFLWKALIPEIVEHDDDMRLVGIGSLLSRNLDLVPGGKVVFGTGSGYSSAPSPEQARNWRIYCVRGPLTAHVMGLSSDLAITDAAWLIDALPNYNKVPTEKSGTVFIPHWTTAKFGAWESICAASEVTFLDPLRDCGEIFDAIANAELAIVESLHGAIIADYYRTPWVPVVTPSRVLNFKWLDWCGSLELEYMPYVLPPSDYLDCLVQRVPPAHVDTSLQRFEVRPWDVVQTPPPPSRANVLYTTKHKIRKPLRKLRDVSWEKASKFRKGPIFSRWNESHYDDMMQYMKEIKRQRPVLSSEAVRSRRLAQLAAALNKLRNDFHAGVFSKPADLLP